MAETVVHVGTCVHGQTAMRIVPGGTWLHVPTLARCDRPPGEWGVVGRWTPTPR